jgi:hypothetical protein
VQSILINLPNWIEALAALGIVALTYLTLVVLKDYAADTKLIARASGSQLEASQMPFLVVVEKPRTPEYEGGWVIENQGFGPAINATWTYTQAGKVILPIPSLAPRAFRGVQNRYPQLIGNPQGVSIDYESLSGLKYQTLITWGNEGSPVIQFNLPPHEADVGVGLDRHRVKRLADKLLDRKARFSGSNSEAT